MSKRILYYKKQDAHKESALLRFRELGYEVSVCDTCAQDISAALEEDFFYFVFSYDFIEVVYNACLGTATKYLSCFEEENRDLYDALRQNYHPANCYFMLQSEECMEQPEACLFSRMELEVYHAINELHLLRKSSEKLDYGLKQLRDVAEEAEVLRKTDVFFDKLEREKAFVFRLRDKLLEYLDVLLAQRSINAWREIILWNKRHECRELMNVSWQFLLLLKAGKIYAEEMLEYHKSGKAPFIVRIGSFEELYFVYFQTLLLLRRLEYDVVPEDNCQIAGFVKEIGISWPFIRSVVEENQIDDEEKVYRRLEELLISYE